MRVLLAIFLMVVVVTTAGCTRWNYTPTPECEYAKPPSPQAYLKGNVDERLVMMTQAYTGQVVKTTECNSNIEKINAKNTALFQ